MSGEKEYRHVRRISNRKRGIIVKEIGIGVREQRLLVFCLTAIFDLFAIVVSCWLAFLKRKGAFLLRKAPLTKLTMNYNEVIAPVASITLISKVTVLSCCPGLAA